MAINYDYPAPWLYTACRTALRMARAHRGERRTRVWWQERAADYRETIVDKLRQRAGWTLAERVAGRR